MHSLPRGCAQSCVSRAHACTPHGTRTHAARNEMTPLQRHSSANTRPGRSSRARRRSQRRAPNQRPTHPRGRSCAADHTPGLRAHEGLAGARALARAAPAAQPQAPRAAHSHSRGWRAASRKSASGLPGAGSWQYSHLRAPARQPRHTYAGASRTPTDRQAGARQPHRGAGGPSRAAHTAAGGVGSTRRLVRAAAGAAHSTPRRAAPRERSSRDAP
jgi:hypothetical protein